VKRASLIVLAALSPIASAVETVAVYPSATQGRNVEAVIEAPASGRAGMLAVILTGDLESADEAQVASRMARLLVRGQVASIRFFERATASDPAGQIAEAKEALAFLQKQYGRGADDTLMIGLGEAVTVLGGVLSDSAIGAKAALLVEGPTYRASYAQIEKKISARSIPVVRTSGADVVLGPLRKLESKLGVSFSLPQPNVGAQKSASPGAPKAK
jgi:hypothetical protein